VLIASMGVFVFAVGPPASAVETEFRPAVYGGTSTGRFDSELERAWYVGTALDTRASEGSFRDRDRAPGVSGHVGVALEYEARQELRTTGWDTDGQSLLFAMRARGGWQGVWFGFELGGIVMSAFDDEDEATTTPLLVPDVEFSVGPRWLLNGVVGVGCSGPSALRRPGIYVGLDAVIGNSGRLELRGGRHRAGPGALEDGELRVSALLELKLNGVLSAWLSGAVAGFEKEERASDGEGAAGIVLTY
jgi:hypothetical protein